MLKQPTVIDYYENIPQELKQYPQWVCYKADKVPYDPKTHEKANVVNHKTWGTFEQAKWCVEQGYYAGVGFVLTKGDPFIFIDLDNPQGDAEVIMSHKTIQAMFPTYTETSPSLNGLHLIGKATCVRGKRDSKRKLEMYDSGRYMTMTGYCTANYNVLADVQQAATQLYQELGGTDLQYETTIHDNEMAHDDFKVIEMCRNAKNGEFFMDLFEGRWEKHYASQSEADLSLMNLIAFISQNQEQTVRIFHMSFLGKRDKAQRKDFIDGLIRKAFENVPPPIDVSQLVNQPMIERKAQANQPIQLSELPVKPAEIELDFAHWERLDDVPIPPGLVGDIMKYTYNAAPRPVAEAALMSAVGLIAGISGRTYNVNGTGLNMYMLLLADTGVGKNSMDSGIENIMYEVINGSDRVESKVPAADQFIGMGHFPSGQAIIKHLANVSPCCYSLVGEFGLKMHDLAEAKNNENARTLKATLLDLYMKSGANARSKPITYSDKKNNVAAVESPALTIMGETTPQTFFAGLTEGVIGDGLLPRFWYLTHEGKRKYINRQPSNLPPDVEMIHEIQSLANRSLIIQADSDAKKQDRKQHIIHVQFYQDAYDWVFDLDDKITDLMNNSQEDTIKQLWNRVHLNTLRLASIVAVGVNKSNPIITLDVAKWAYKMVSRDVEEMTRRFDQGLIGRSDSEVKQIAVIEGVFKKYFRADTNHLETYNCNFNMHASGVIGWSYISKNCLTRKAFKDARGSASQHLRNCIKLLEDSGDIAQVNRADMERLFSTSQIGYAVKNLDRFT